MTTYLKNVRDLLDGKAHLITGDSIDNWTEAAEPMLAEWSLNLKLEFDYIDPDTNEEVYRIHLDGPLPLITVKGYLGHDKLINRGEFIDTWVSHARQLHNLSWDHYEEFKAITDRVQTIAGEEFDKILAKQTAGQE